MTSVQVKATTKLDVQAMCRDLAEAALEWVTQMEEATEVGDFPNPFVWLDEDVAYLGRALADRMERWLAP